MVIKNLVHKKSTIVIDTGNESKTQQQFAEESNINSIMKKYKQTGILGSPIPGKAKPQFGDYTGVDFQAMQNVIASANTAFNELPAAVRAKFGNNVQKLVEFLDDPTNREKAIEIGLIERKPAHEKPVEKTGSDHAPLDVMVTTDTKTPKTAESGSQK